MVGCSEDAASNDEYALLLALRPLNNFVGSLRDHGPVDVGACHAVEFENGSHPRQARRLLAGRM